MLPGFLDHRWTANVSGRAVRLATAGDSALQAQVVVMVALHNQAAALPDCLASIAGQQGVPVSVAVLLLDDSSTDDWLAATAGLLSTPRLVVAQTRCGTAATARNCLLDLVDGEFPTAHWAARLDADDRFATAGSLAAAVRLAQQTGARFVLGGNRLRERGSLLTRTNPATPQLFEPPRLLERLASMAGGIREAELPSCNLLLARHAGWRYPTTTSGEDHWLVAELLLRHRTHGALLPAPFYADYTLDGPVTQENTRHQRYLASRAALWTAAQQWVAEGAVSP